METLRRPRTSRRLLTIVIAAATCGVGAMGSVAHAVLLYSSNGYSIFEFTSENPNAVTETPVSGLQQNERLIGIDVRAADSKLYGLSSASRLFTINPATGGLTVVGAPPNFVNDTFSGFGLDFNPLTDQLRMVGVTEQNVRINPNNGSLIATDTPLNPAGSITGIAYDRNFPGAPATTLFGIDGAARTLVRIGGVDGTPSPDTGVVTTIGSLRLPSTNPDDLMGFDIAGSGTGYLTYSLKGVATLYEVDLTTGATTAIGRVDPILSTRMLGLTVATIVPEPSAALLVLAGISTVAALRRRRL